MIPYGTTPIEPEIEAPPAYIPELTDEIVQAVLETRRSAHPPVTVHGLTGAARTARRRHLAAERQLRMRERQRLAGIPINSTVDRAIAAAVRAQALDPESALAKAIVKDAAKRLIRQGKENLLLRGDVPYEPEAVVRQVVARIFRTQASSEAAASGHN